MQLSTAVLNNSVHDHIEALKEMGDALQGHRLALYTASEVDITLGLAKEHRPEFAITDCLLRGCTATEAVN